MDLQLKGKTALVTGASQGIGRAIASELAAEGAHVAIAARRVDLLKDLAKEIVSRGHQKPVVIEADLTNPESPHRLVTAAHQKLGRIDILINSAGGSRPVPIEVPVEQWQEGMLINFFRAREITHAALPGMIAQRWGRIVNITGSSEPRDLNVANAAKAALHAWAKGLSREVAKHGITVNSIQPGLILSEQIRRLWPMEESRREFSAREIPAGRFGEPEELAPLAAFFASERARYITGTVIPVDGGLSRFAF